MVDIYSEWQKFKNILPVELAAAGNYDDLVKYFDGKNETRKYLLATNKNGNPIGACYIDTEFIELQNIRLGDLMVKEEFRKLGVGSKLVDEVIKFAKENKCKKVWLWAQKELTSAIKLYEKKGFILEATLKNQFCNKDALIYGLIIS